MSQSVVAYGPGAAAPKNPMGINLPAGGSGSFSYEGLPLFQDHTKSGRWATYPQAVDANDWPTTDWGFILTECTGSPSWLTVGGNGKFLCGFKSKNANAEVITGSGCTISARTYDAVTQIVSFDVLITNPTGNPSYAVTNTNGGSTNIFNWLPAYRTAGGFTNSTAMTAEAITVYSPLDHHRNMWMNNTWYDGGEQIPFTGTAAIGATAATLNKVWAGTTGSKIVIFTCTLGQTPDIRTVTMTNGVAAMGAISPPLSIAATGATFQNSATNRRTPTNTKTRGSWNGFGISSEAYPHEWAVDSCIQCGNNVYLTVPLNADATYIADVCAMLNTKLLPYPTLKVIVEVGNEPWNGGPWAGCSAALNALATLNGFTVTQQLAQLYRAWAVALRTAFGTTKFNSNVLVNVCWQQSQVSFFSSFLAYYLAQWGAPATDLKYISTAPYFNTSVRGFTASIAATGIMTVTTCLYPTIGAGATVTGPSVPAASVINSQIFPLTGVEVPNGVGRYQLSTTGVTIGSEAMNCALDNNATVAQILTHLTAMAGVANASYGRLENLSIIACAYGLQQATYEDGHQTNAEVGTIVNLGAAILAPGMEAVMNSHYVALFNSGVVTNTPMEGGTFGGALPNNRAPVDQFSMAFPPTIANSPRYKSIMNFVGGTPPPTKNVVSGVGSIIRGEDYADNISGRKGNFNLGSNLLAPHMADAGRCPYWINCTAPATYNLDVTFSGVVGTVTSDVEVNGMNVIATAVSVPAGVGSVVTRLAAVPLVLGGNYICLGKATGQTAQIEQMQTN